MDIYIFKRLTMYECQSSMLEFRVNKIEKRDAERGEMIVEGPHAYKYKLYLPESDCEPFSQRSQQELTLFHN